MYIIREKLFGYFDASSYFSPFFGSLILVKVPTPSFFAVFMTLVGYADFLADPLGPPTLPLLFIFIFIMRHIFRRRMG